MKVYFSRAMTRAMSFEHPIGDPTGGAAYGEYRDPVTAVAIFEMGTTAEVVAAGTATFFQGLTFAGGAMSLLGKATGNKDLMALGSVAGMAGGIGTLSGSSYSPFSSMDSAPISNWEGQALTPDNASNFKPNLSNTPTTNWEGAPLQQASATNGGGLNPSAPNTAGIPTSTNPSETQANLTNPGASNLTDWQGMPLNQAPGSGTGLLDKAMSFTKTNPMGAYIAAQAVGGAADMLSGMTPAKIAALKAQTDAQNFANQRTQQGIANLNTGALTVQPNILINPNAIQSNYPSNGLISGARTV